MLVRFAVSLALMVSLATGAAYASADAPTMGAAITDYNMKRYSEALGKLNTLIKATPNSAILRYYRGLCFQSLNQINQAKSEFYWVYTNAPEGRLKVNAQMALNQIQQWSAHREYSGQGNRFQRVAASRGGKGGGNQANCIPTASGPS